MARSTAGHRSILLTFPENCRRSLGCELSNIAQQTTETRINTCWPANVTRSWKGPPMEGAADERALNAYVRKQSRHV
jgi:hypothetical protein